MLICKQPDCLYGLQVRISNMGIVSLCVVLLLGSEICIAGISKVCWCMIYNVKVKYSCILQLLCFCLMWNCYDVMASHSSTLNYVLYSILQYNQFCFWKKYNRGIGYFYGISCNFINSSYDEICAKSSCPRCVKFLNFTGLSYDKWLNSQLGTSSKIVTTSCLAHFIPHSDREEVSQLKPSQKRL